MPDRYNILLIVTDQERSWETLPSGLTLPARERLRGSGTYFPNFHANAVACSPSRSNIYTGRHIQTTGIFDNAGRATRLSASACPTIGRMLRARGYFTVYAGKWHLSADEDLVDAEGGYGSALKPFGFDLFRPNSPFGDSYGGPQEGSIADIPLADWVRRWIAGASVELPQDKPWFMAANFINPHDIMFFDATGQQRQTQLARWAAMAREPEWAPYGDDLDFDLPPNFGSRARNGPRVHAAFAQEAAYMFGELPAADERAWRRYQNYYFNCIRDVDRTIGTVLDALDEADAAKRTIVLFTSDHGEMGGAHTLRGKGPVIYRENFSVPLVIRHPDCGASSSNALASAVDIVPTILDLAGGMEARDDEAPPELVGYSLKSVLGNPARKGPRTSAVGILLNCSVIHASNPATTRRYADAVEKGERISPKWPQDFLDPGLKSFVRGIFDGRYRFGRYFDPLDHHRPTTWRALTTRNELELYDTLNDPLELDNLAAGLEENKPLIQKLNRKLNALIAQEVGDDDGSYLPKD